MSEQLEQALDAIEQAMEKLDISDHYQQSAWRHLQSACDDIGEAVRQEQINENVDLCETLGGVE